MAIIVQTVDIEEGANSYNTAAEAVAYAAERGTTITELAATPLLYKSMDIIDQYSYSGYLVDTDQTTKAPRDYIYDNNARQYYTRQQVLNAFKKAQAELVLQMYLGYDPYGVSTEPRVKSESFGPFSTTYMDDPDDTNYLTHFNQILAPFINGIVSNGIHFKLVGPTC